MTSLNYINIGGDPSDPTFRYKMPPLQTKTEGKGNGIKTILLNLSDVAKSLFTSPDYIAKFLSIELGCSYKHDENRTSLNGSHTFSTLSSYLDKFIKLIILCPRCHLPELSLSISKNQLLLGNCSACGYNAPIKSTHKIVSYILKNPPSIPKAVPIASNVSSSISVIDVEEKEVEWLEDVSKEAQKARFLEEMESRPEIKTSVVSVETTPSAKLRAFINENKNPSQILSELRRIELVHQLSPSDRFHLILQSILDLQNPKNLVKNINENKVLIQLLVKDKLMLSTFMGAIESVFGMENEGKCLSRFSLILKELYDMDIFSEEFLLCWYESPAESSITVPKKIAIQLRQSASSFIEWLKTAESDDE